MRPGLFDKRVWYGRKTVDGSPEGGSHLTWGSPSITYTSIQSGSIAGVTAVSNCELSFTTLAGTVVSNLIVPAGVHLPIKMTQLQVVAGFTVIHYHDFN